MPELETPVMDAPSAGAIDTSTVDTSAPSPSSDAPATPASPPDTRSMTDDQIMELPSESDTPAEPEAEDAEKQPEPGQGDTPTDKPAEAAAEDGRTIPAKYRELFKSDPELRGLFFRDRANTEKLKAVEAELPTLREAVQSVERTDAAFLSGDPTQQRPIIERWAKQSPAAVESAVKEADQILKQVDPQRFEQLSTSRFVEGMKSEQFDAFFGSVKHALDTGDTEMLTKIGQGMLAWGQKFGFQETEKQAVERRAKDLDAKEASLKTKETQDYQRTFDNFKTESNKQIDTATNEKIGALLDRLLVKSSFTDWQRNRISEDIQRSVSTEWNQDQELLKQAAQIIAPNGRPEFSPTTMSKANALILAKIDARLPQLAKPIIDQWTQGFVASSTQKAAKAATAASRADVTGAAPQPQAKAPLKVTPQTRKMTDDQIWNLP